MTIEELNKLIKEELEAYLGEDEEDGGDDIEVTTDEPELDDEGEDDDEELDEGKDDKEEVKKEGKDDEDEKNEAVGYPNYSADQIGKVKADVTDVNKGLNESVDVAARWKKLANIK